MGAEVKANGRNDSKKKAPTRYWREIKGHLYARLQYQDESGKWREKLKPIQDKRIARRLVEEMRQEVFQHGIETLQADKMTFRELSGEYEKIKLVPAIYQDGIKIAGKRSLAPTKSALNSLLAFFGSNKIRSIKASDIEAYKQSRLVTKTNRGLPLKIATVNRELSLLRVMLNFAVQNEWLIKNPFVLAKGAISTSSEIERDRVLSFEEEYRLLSVSMGPRSHLRPLLICALDTAMRRGEMFKMRWSDVDLVKNEIFIPQTNTKTEDSRTVGITLRLREELLTLWEVSPKDKNALVFGITDTVKTSWKTACRLAGIGDFRLHDCRHTATTRMIASGSPHTEVMKITGHSQIKTFLRYLSITSETANRVAFRLNEYTSERAYDVELISEKVC
ncbi:MAG TPA: site-specific integrase [Pyrinomonadaceae bacterium]|nr:site-specific integrase [Pyrinomonadaceae bacterium]HMP66587.1 site-specific integrase [Pyrinomonadaceae bacterium]